MQRLTLVANGAMLRFVILHGDLKHIVASNANAMDFQRLLARIVFSSGFTMPSCVRIAHWQILTRNADITKTSPPSRFRASQEGHHLAALGLLRQATNGSVTIL